MIQTFWTLAYNLTKMPIIFDSGYPQLPAYELTPHAFAKMYTWKTREEAITGLANFERVHPDNPERVGIMKISIEIDRTVELIDEATVKKAQTEAILKRLDPKDAALIRAQL